MRTWKDIKSLTEIRDDVKHAITTEPKAKKFKSMFQFLGFYGYCFKLMMKEKELFFFVFLQWASVAIGYYLFVMMLYWIPEEVWRSTEGSDEGSIADLVLFLWIIVCIGVAALPMAIASSCMAVVHFLHAYDKPSTIAACLKVVLPRTWSLWLFHWVDGYFTVDRIIDRLPKKNDRTPWAKRMLDEALYYAWKVATMAILPNLITGRGIKDTAKNSIDMIKKHASELMIIRTGYSLLCWIVAIATYAWGIWNIGWIKEKFIPGDIYSNIAEFYLIAGIPMLFSVGIIKLFIRPVYIIAISDIYIRYTHEKGEPLVKEEPPSPAISAFVAFGFLCMAVLIVYLYRYQLGIMVMLATPYGETYTPPQ